MNNIPIPSRPATVDEALALVRTACVPLEPESVSLSEAAGRVLCEMVTAPEDQPPFDRSSVDGYAVWMDDDSTRLQVIDSIRAGQWKPRQLQLGQAVQIATGGALPGEGLQVVMKEDVHAEADTITVLRRARERNIRFRGEDARAGATLISEGTVLGPGALAFLASVGHVRPSVTRRPRVLHLVTGDEIVPPEQEPQPGQIRDSNTTLVRAFLAQWGITPHHLRLPEDAAQTESKIRDSESGWAQTDLLLISGGASVGEHDFTRQLLEHFGYAIQVSRTTTRPGKPLIFATRGRAVAFGLPGNPLAHFVCLNLYVRAAVDTFQGRPGGATFARAALAVEFQSEPNARETLWPARLEMTESRLELTPLPWRSSGDLTPLATANALVRIPSGCDKLPRGALVEFIATAPLT